MKKVTLLLVILLLISANSSDGARRVVLAEKFTSTTCPPCATSNPYFDNWLKGYAKKDSVAVIKYHVWWPSPGNDPYYAANPSQVQTRNSYYGNNYVPRMFIDGNIDGGSSYTTWPSTISSRHSNVSPFEMSITGAFSSSGGLVRIKVKSDGTAIPAGTLVLHTVVTENGLVYTGTNGDPYHENVMRMMYPNASGETFTISLRDSVTFTREISWNPNWVIENCEIIAFVQIQGTKAVLQAAKRSLASMIGMAAPSLISPLNGSNKVNLNPTLTWNPASGASSYRLQFSTDSTFNTTLIDTSNLLATSFVLKNTQYNTTYYWRVRASNAYVTSNWSTSYRFKTLFLTSSLYSAGWNIVSVPVEVVNWRKNQIFPQAVSDAFKYTGNYIKEDTLKKGYAYWLKFNDPINLQFLGSYISNDTLNLQLGWNLIGSISQNIPVSEIVTDPPDIINSNFWFFISGQGYRNVDTLKPGFGYWVKSKEVGKLILNSEIVK